MNSERVYDYFRSSIEAKMEVGETLAPLIDHASQILVNALLNEKKILCCGNGMSSALMQIFSSAMLDRFEKERPSLPAIFLDGHMANYNSINTDNGFNELFAKPIRALGQAGDVLLIASTSGNSANLINAIGAAHDREMTVVALTGHDGGNISSLIDVADIELRAETTSRARIHEIHLLSIFSLCDLIDLQLFGLD
ncbi:MAG: D-sedoheptulose 7-phosphate isomerase [Flavobacteriales bacterium]|jgi:D-sedoheptulose 7-phosphate isomerase